MVEMFGSLRKIITLYQGGQEVFLVQCRRCLVVEATIDVEVTERLHRETCNA